MSDLDTLAAAVAAAPDDDLPRLVYADFIEEAGDADYAKFIRDQIELARLPPWDPTFVRITREMPHWKTFAGRLPVLGDGRALAWDDPPFRRGFGYAVRATFPAALVEAGDALFAAAPVGRLRVSTATLADWQRIARCPWLRNLRELAFDGIETPVEPTDVLIRSPHLTGLTGVEFGVADGPGMPIVVQRLLQSEVGRGLKSLALHSAPRQPEEMIAALAGIRGARLESFRYRGGSLSRPEHAELLSTTMLSTVKHLDLSGCRLGWHAVEAIPTWVDDLELIDCHLRHEHLARFTFPVRRQKLQSLNLRDNAFSQEEGPVQLADPSYAGLRILNLSRTFPEPDVIDAIVKGVAWLKLISLDVSDNRISDFEVTPLVTAPLPPGLERLALFGNKFTKRFRMRLLKRFGDGVQFEDPGEPGA